MKRIHLFEIEDFSWCPQFIRDSLTNLIVVVHKLLGSSDALSKLVLRAVQHSEKPSIVDLCSGSGGPMIEVYKKITKEYAHGNLTLTLTDLYPNKEVAEMVNKTDPKVIYLTQPIDATNVNASLTGVRTMVGSFHHMPPDVARKILKDAMDRRQPICIFEISDNSVPMFLWWIAIPMNFIMALFITPMAKSLTLKQIFFTYIVPVIPLCFAWDGAVSNARTYTLDDMSELTRGLIDKNYIWEKGTVEGRGKKLFLLGLPLTTEAI